MNGLRWAFNFTNWKPIQAEWMFAAQCIQPEEKERISHFMFQKDAKAAMVGEHFFRVFYICWGRWGWGEVMKIKRYSKRQIFILAYFVFFHLK